MRKKNRKELEKFYRKKAKEYARKYWGVEFDCRIIFVNREWKRLNASFRYWIDGSDCEIRLNLKRHDLYGAEEYLKILKHEMVHWYLWREGKSNGDDDPEFIRECLRVGASISSTKKAKQAYQRVVASMGAHFGGM